MEDPATLVMFGAVLAVMISFYFLPTIIAGSKNHPNRHAIFLVNLFLGWSGLAWFVTLIWAIVGPRAKSTPDRASVHVRAPASFRYSDFGARRSDRLAP